MDPVLAPVAGLGASVVKFLLRASDRELGADLVGDAQEGLGLLARLRGQVNDRNGAVAKRIEKAVAGRVRGMYQKCSARGVDTERLDGVATEVVRLVDRVAADDSLILKAACSPDGFAALLHDLGGPIRATLFERSEPYFDELVDAVAEEYVRLAPWSPKFQIEALKHIVGALDRIEEGVDEIRAGVNKGLENDQVTHSELGAIRSEVSGLRDDLSAVSTGPRQPGRVLFGSRPGVAARFVKREEYERLRSRVIDERCKRTVLVGMAGCGKSQLASFLARECEAEGWDLVAWINASSATAVTSELVELALQLGFDTKDKPNKNIVIDPFLEYLKHSASGDRLIVFDNLEKIEDLPNSIITPEGEGLRVVATTRSGRGWKFQEWQNVDVATFPREESIAYLLKATDSQDEIAANAVAERLGDLPLAIAQAAATTSNCEWTLKRYLGSLDKPSDEKVIELVPGDAYTIHVSKTLLQVVKSALDRIGDGLRDTARRQLGALAVLAESGVPTRWLDPLAEEKAREDENGKAGQGPDVLDDADEDAHLALTALAKASVVQKSTDGRTVSLHRLQAHVLRKKWNDAERKKAFEAAERTLTTAHTSQVFPIPDPPWTRNEKDDYLKSRLEEESEMILQLTAIVTQAHSQSLFKRKEIQELTIHLLEDSLLPHFGFDMSDTVKTMIEQLTWDDTATIRAAHALASTLLDEPADAHRAIALLEPAYQHAIKFEQLSPLTPDIRRSLAIAYMNAQRYDDVTRVLKDDFEHLMKEAGDTSSDNTINYTHILRLLEYATTLAAAHNATHEYETTIHLLEGIKGYIDSDSTSPVGASIFLLAVAHAQTGNMTKSAYLARSLLDKCRNPLEEFTLLYALQEYQYEEPNDKHIWFLETLLKEYADGSCGDEKSRPINDTIQIKLQTALDEAYSQAGSGRSSVQLFQRHYDTVRRNDATLKQVCIARHMLATAYYHSHNIAQSLELAEENHTVSKLAFGSRSMQADSAEELLVRVYEASSGTKDLRTLESQNNYAMTLARHSDFRVAKSLLEATLKAGEHTLSPDHPLTVQIRKNLKAVEREMNQSPTSSPESSEE